MNVDASRLRADIEGNATFGALDVDEGRGRTVLCGTEPNREARERLIGRFEDAGLDVRVDAVGNIAGRWIPPSANPAASAVASGSHLDSVPGGGIFDGPLGVYGALEAVRAMQQAELEPRRPVEVISFTEEEGGRFGSGVLGSSVATGVRSIDEALTLRDEDGVSLDTALDTIGFSGDAEIDASEWSAWVELHIEQSGRLEAASVPVGIVTDITGITLSRVSIQGEADHAGTTSMGDRTDALAAAAEFVLDVEEGARQVVANSSESAVGTVGRVSVEPNAPNVVPGAVEVGVDIRDTTEAGIDAVIEAAEASLDRLEIERGVHTTFDTPLDITPTPMSDRIQVAARDGGSRANIATTDLHSGAGHDSLHVASVTDAGMLFAPSREGISHSPLEWTDWDDCAAATRVLAETLADLAGAI